MIYYILDIFLLVVFVAALIGSILFACVVIDAIDIWNDERKERLNRISWLDRLPPKTRELMIVGTGLFVVLFFLVGLNAYLGRR